MPSVRRRPAVASRERLRTVARMRSPRHLDSPEVRRRALWEDLWIYPESWDLSWDALWDERRGPWYPADCDVTSWEVASRALSAGRELDAASEEALTHLAPVWRRELGGIDALAEAARALRGVELELFLGLLPDWSGDLAGLREVLSLLTADASVQPHAMLD